MSVVDPKTKQPAGAPPKAGAAQAAPAAPGSEPVEPPISIRNIGQEPAPAPGEPAAGAPALSDRLQEGAPSDDANRGDEGAAGPVSRDEYNRLLESHQRLEEFSGHQAEEIGELRVARPGIAERPGVGQPPAAEDAAAAAQADPAVMAAWATSAAANDPTAFLQALEVRMEERVKAAVDNTAREYMTRARDQQGFQAGFFQENPGLASGEAREIFDGKLYAMAAQNRGLNQQQLYGAAAKATLALMDRLGLEQVPANDPAAAAVAAEAARLQGPAPRGSRPPATPAPVNQADLLKTFTKDVGAMADRRMSRVMDPRLPETSQQ